MAIRCERIHIDMFRTGANYAAADAASNRGATPDRELESILRQLGSSAEGVIEMIALPVDGDTIDIDDGNAVYVYEFVDNNRALTGTQLPSGNIAVNFTGITNFDLILRQLAIAITKSAIKINVIVYDEQDYMRKVLKLNHRSGGLVGNHAMVASNVASITTTGMINGGNPPTAANTISAQFIGPEGSIFVIIWDDAAAALRGPADEDTVHPPT